MQHEDLRPPVEWIDVEQQADEMLTDTARVFEDSEHVDDFEPLDVWTVEYREGGDSITFTHPDGAWVRISEGSGPKGYDVYTRRAADDAVPQVALRSGSATYGVDRCLEFATTKMASYCRDGSF